jgi:hypothetical protein
MNLFCHAYVLLNELRTNMIIIMCFYMASYCALLAIVSELVQIIYAAASRIALRIILIMKFVEFKLCPS